ncbi:MAG: CopG family transcriptional regulator [Deltaproteobacteria bacterium]|nr:CopG family transcriptional regulator [Deltaproteobacteria bacterium]
MKNKIIYTDEPMGKIRIIRDFLPPPEELAFKEDQVKVTIALSKTSVAYFKKQARKYHTPYQKMIRRLLDVYTSKADKAA